MGTPVTSVNLSNYIYSDSPSFGIDIGHSTVKIMQLGKMTDRYIMKAYGNAQLDKNSIDKGEIVDHESIARTLKNLLTSQLVGKISVNKIAFSVPNEYSFSRVLTVPSMSHKELISVINTELEQSMPIKSEDLYYDYDTVSVNGDIEIQLVAAPKIIIDSYVSLSQLLGLEVAFVETNISAVTRAVKNTEITQGVVSLIIDMGSSAADLTLYDGVEIRITSTANCGGEAITKSIAEELGINAVQAHILKTKYGIDPSKRQREITKAVAKVLENLFTEINKVNKYIVERPNGRPIDQIIIVGGGSNIPGISSYITESLKIPTRVCNVWKDIDFGVLPKPENAEKTIYTTAIGLAMGSEKEFVK